MNNALAGTLTVLTPRRPHIATVSLVEFTIGACLTVLHTLKADLQVRKKEKFDHIQNRAVPCCVNYR